LSILIKGAELWDIRKAFIGLHGSFKGIRVIGSGTSLRHQGLPPPFICTVSRCKITAGEREISKFQFFNASQMMGSFIELNLTRDLKKANSK
jgi:hypothetical protein